MAAAGGCGRGKHSLRSVLRHKAPEVFLLQVAWEHVHESADSIGETLRCISQVRAQHADQQRLPRHVCELVSWY